jgi:UDP-N-acetylmuramoylalanine--D-glutamate ligase
MMNMAAADNHYDAVVVGLGETGYACVAHLGARGQRVAVVDTRNAPPQAERLRADYPEVSQYLGAVDADLLCSAAAVVVSPGVDTRLPAIAAARQAGVPVIGEIELFARSARAPVVAITGSNGKSTVTSMVGEMMRAGGWCAGVGGNLGPAALTLITDPEPDCYVLELSSFQLETVATLDAAAAVVLNISPDHLDRYDDLADYIAAKRRIYRGTGTMVLNADDPAVTAMAEPGRAIRRFSLGEPGAAGDAGIIRYNGAAWLVVGGEPVMPVSDLPLAGAHNTANALAALALGAAMGLSPAAMAAGLSGFAGLAHRMEALGEYWGCRWYNDSKATNVGATVAAVSGLDRPFVLIAGGQGKDQSFAPLADVAANARGVVVMGESASAVEAVVGDITGVVHATSMSDAVTRAAALARPGDAVVLSPACASFDQYDGYAQRGEAFRTAVEGLGDG